MAVKKAIEGNNNNNNNNKRLILHFQCKIRECLHCKHRAEYLDSIETSCLPWEATFWWMASASKQANKFLKSKENQVSRGAQQKRKPVVD